MNNRRKVLLGLGASSALAAWHTPVINRIVTPAHAQASVCPMITIGNVVFGPVSGTNTPPVCTATFDVLSADAVIPLNITSIDAGTLPADTTVDVQNLGTASNTAGPRVVWQGPATDAPFCSDLTPVDDITFTITASCDAVTDGGTFTQTFLLSEILVG